MRIDINTKGKPVKDSDIRALHILDYAMNISSDKMLKANLEFVMSKYENKIHKNK